MDQDVPTDSADSSQSTGLLSALIPMNPAASPVSLALLSLIVPGLGQVYLGQWWRGTRLFLSAAPFCFGFGLANIAFAYDAYSLGTLNQTQAIRTELSSKTLYALDGLLDLIFGAFRMVAWAFDWFMLQIPLVNLFWKFVIKGEHR